MKLLSTYFGGQTVYLMRLYNVVTEDLLPEIWTQLARKDLKQHRGIIQQHVDEMANLLAPGMLFLVTLVIVKKVVTLEFHMVNQ